MILILQGCVAGIETMVRLPPGPVMTLWRVWVKFGQYQSTTIIPQNANHMDIPKDVFHNGIVRATAQPAH